MRKLIVVIVLAITVLVGAVVAPRAQAQNYPQVGNLTPFTAETNYMSLPGFLRFSYLQSSGTWISHDQAVEIVKQQQGR
jgi:hypothetical protein